MELSKFRVGPKLEVGPTRVEKQRIVTAYKIGSDVFELIYRWEEDVFEPGRKSDENLGSLIGSQVALNYGLFFDEIVFHGPFSKTDKSFLTNMAKNTAREIYVNKLLMENPFLKDEWTGLEAEKRDDYLFAKLSFSDKFTDGDNTWMSLGKNIAVLSSGGKDSLLSFGLLNEIGKDVHSIFINESGRHWFTALNAYRHFRDNESGTGRVWTNADRAYTWFLRHFPFIRQDFATKRADEYPIRLWTVAVFLFGALPLLRKRAIGQLVIGDEFDTTRRRHHQGIPHYEGLFDQSRFFDETLSKFFFKKGWQISQFSILRPLSEILIEKILVERYPKLQALQVSCHAAHTEGNKVKPCGRCEKCRRIVGMLAALSADPENCGYNQQMVKDCLSSLANESVHQEAAGAAHLLHLLKCKGVKNRRAKAHPEIMKLRFDNTSSPLDAIPIELRLPLYEIYLQHSEGALVRRERHWEELTLLSGVHLNLPYGFEHQPSKKPDRCANHRLGELRWPEAKERLQQVDLAMLPVGSCEQHGPHLPLDTDGYDAELLAEQVASLCSQPRPLVLPLVPYGVSYHHDNFPGTISVGPEALSRLVYDIGMSIAKQGIKKLVIVNGHGGNGPALHFACQRINRDAHIFTCVESGETSDTDVDSLAETRNDVHAGEVETSTSLYLRPELVDLKSAKKCVPNFSSKYLEFSSHRAVEWYARVARFSPEGVIGDPTVASREKGEKYWSIIVQRLREFIEELKTLSLDEIYSRRY